MKHEPESIKNKSIEIVTDTRFEEEITAAQFLASDTEQPASGNVLPLLYEVRHAIARWIDSGETSVIDIRKIPLSESEEQDFEAALGEGEVNACLDCMGRTTMIETKVPGVWLVTHFNNEDQVMVKYIEINAVPEIMKSQLVGVRRGLEALDQYLDEITGLSSIKKD